jgi:heme-degrading monooxygenase HmoA
MNAVMFEVWPKDGKLNDYLDIAAALKPGLSKIDGFISVERFQSLTEPNKYLSLSFWRDEDAIEAWREHVEHRAAQRRGREQLFADFRIRVATVVRDYGMEDGAVDAFRQAAQ